MRCSRVRGLWAIGVVALVAAVSCSSSQTRGTIKERPTDTEAPRSEPASVAPQRDVAHPQEGASAPPARSAHGVEAKQSNRTEARDCAQASGQWVLSDGPPEEGWWADFVAGQALAPRSTRETRVPHVRSKLFSTDPQAHTRWQPRLEAIAGKCYTVAVARKLVSRRPGHWVARFSHVGDGHICSIDVVATDLPDQVTECIVEHVLERRMLSSLVGVPGIVEVAVAMVPD